MQIFNSLWSFVSNLWIFIVFTIALIIAIFFFAWFLKKKKVAGISISVAMIAAMAAIGLIYLKPHGVVDVDTKDVTKIEVSGVSVTDEETIGDILKDLGSSEYQRTLPSGIGGLEEYSVIGFDENGNILFHIGISTDQKIDTGMFWENRVNGRFNLSLYASIVSEDK